MTISSKRRHPNRKKWVHTLAGPLREVRWPVKFKAGHIDQYDGSSNPEEFLQVYQTIIETAGGDDWVNANFCIHHCLEWPDRGSSTYLNDPFTPGTSCVPCSSRTSRAHMSVHLLPRLSGPSSRSMMKVSVIMSSISVMPGMPSHTSRTSISSMPSMMASTISRLWKR
jgi:hypothetical protein